MIGKIINKLKNIFKSIEQKKEEEFKNITYAVVKLPDWAQELGIPPDYLHWSYYIIEIRKGNETLYVMPYSPWLEERLRKEMPVIWEIYKLPRKVIWHENIFRYEI